MLLLLLFAVFIIPTSCTDTELAVTEDDLNQYLDDSVAAFKLQLHQASQRQHTRVKRTITLSDFMKPTATVYESQIASITPVQSVPTMHPVELEPFEIQNSQYLAVVNFQDENFKYQTKSAIYIYNQTSGFTLLQTFDTSGGIDFEFADIGEEKYAIFLDHVGQNWYGGDSTTYQKWFQVNQFLPDRNEKQPFHYRTKVRALGAKRVKVLVKDQRYPYFVTANSFYESGNQYHVKSTMHFQSPFGYELLQSFETQGAQDVEIFKLEGLWYIVFANHRDNSGNVDIYSYIYREQPRVLRNPFKLYQRLETHGAKDFEYFTFENNHYLVVANEYTYLTSVDAVTGAPLRVKQFNVDSLIYWWTGKMFVEWQRIPTEGAVRWHFFTSDNGDPMLVVSNTKSIAIIYTFDPLRGFFKPTNKQGLSPYPDQPDLVTDVRSVMSFKRNNHTYLAVANYDMKYRNGTNIFRVDFEESPVPAIDPSIPEIITALLMKMKIELEEIKSNLTEVLLHVTNNVMTKSSNQNITGRFSFNTLPINDTLKVNNLLYRINASINPIEDLAKEAVLLEVKLKKQEERIARLDEQFRNAIKINEGVQINSRKVFQNKTTVSRNLETHQIFTNNLIDSVNITNLDEKAWKKNEEQTIEAEFTFKKNVSVSKNVTIKGKLNDKEIVEIMTTNTEQTISGIKEFQSGLEINNDILLKNFTLNGLDIPKDLVRKTGNITISGNKNFTSDIKFSSPINVLGKLNEVILSDFDEKRMSVSENQTISGSILFNSGLDIYSDITVGGLVDGVYLTGLKEDMDKSGKEQIISTPKTFKSITVLGTVETHKINGYNISEAVTLHTTQDINAPMTFEENCLIQGNLTTIAKIDGLKLSTQAVTTNGNQVINGTKTVTAKNTYFDNHIEVNGTINNIDLEYFQRNAIIKNDSREITGNKSFLSGANLIKTFEVESVNNIIISNLTQNLVPIHENRTWSSNYIFENIIINNNLVVNRVNNYVIPDDIVSLNSIDEITGSKIFTENSEFKSNLYTEGNLNNKIFQEVYENSLKNNSDETVYGNTVFNKDVYFSKNINVDGKLNNLSIPNDVITLTTNQNITGTIEFTQDSDFNDVLSTEIILVNTTVNDIDISVMEADAVYKDRNQTINGNIVFVGGVECKQNLSVAGLINGVNLSELINTTVRVSKDQYISGTITFTDDVMLEVPLTSPGTINGINISSLNNLVLKNNQNQTITNDFKINGNVEVLSNLTSFNTSQINNIDFSEFFTSSAKKDQLNIINGSLTYNNKIEIENLTTSTISNINISDILTTNTNQTITRALHFDSVKTEDIELSKLINNINITNLYLDALKKNENQTVFAKYIFLNNVHTNGNVTVNGNINDINLQEFNEDVVHLSGDEVIYGIKVFENVTFGNVSFRNTVNDINLTFLMEDALVKQGDQQICQRKTFGSLFIVNGDKCIFNKINVSGLVSGVNVTNLNLQAVKLTEQQELQGNYNFSEKLIVDGNLTINEKINNMSLQNHFMLTYSDQKVNGSMRFGKGVISNDITVNGLVDKVNVTELKETRFSLQQNDTVYGQLHFNDTQFSKQVVFPQNATINSIDVSEELIDINKDEEIHGKKIFNEVLVRQDLNGTTGIVNGVNLREINQKALRNESSTVQLLEVDQLFTNNLTIRGNMNVTGLINGIKVGQVGNYSNDVSDDIRDDLLSLTTTADKLCNSTTKLMAISATEIVLNGIEKVSITSFGNMEIGEIDSVIIGNHVYVSIARPPKSGCGDGYILKCTFSMECTLLQTILTNSPKIEFFEYNTSNGASNISMFVGHWKSGSNQTMTCAEIPEIYTWSSSQQKFFAFKTVNKDLMETALAPVVYSSSLLAASLGGAYKSVLVEESEANPYDSVKIQVAFFKRGYNINLIIVSRADSNNYDDHVIDVLSVNGFDVSSLQSKQKIKADNGKYIAINAFLYGQYILSISSGVRESGVKLYIYNSAKEKFEFYQKLDIAATSVKIYQMKDQPYLIYASSSSGVGSCRWEGVSGFTGCQNVQVKDAKHIDTVVTNNGAYTLAAVENNLVVYKKIFEGNNKPYTSSIC